MDLKKVGILEKDSFSEQAIEKLKKHYKVLFYDGQEALSDFVNDKYVLFIRLSHKIDDELIKDAHDLRYICSPTTGLNHISITSSKVNIISLKGEYDFLNTIRATPEHIMGLTFSLLRNYKFAFRTIENSDWNRDPYRGIEIYKNHIGIIGYGRIGKLLCGFFQSFGATVHVYEIEEDRYKDRISSPTIVFHKSIKDVIRSSNIIILCVNYEPYNERMINKEHFNLMRGKYFINASRGELINEKDMLDFIEEGDYQGIAIDVFADETGDMQLYKKVLYISADKNIIITPHIGGATYTSMHRTEEFIVEKLLKNDGRINKG